MRQSGSFIQKLAVLYLIIWSIAPPLQVDMIYRLMALGCAGIWAIIALRRGYYYEKIHLYSVIFLMAVIVIAYVEKGSIDGVLQQIAIYILVICFLINHFYEDGKWQELQGIVPVILILLIIFNYKTAEVLMGNHMVARKLVRADETVYSYLRQGIGGYSLIYPQVCIFPAILAWTIKALKGNKICFLTGTVWVYTYMAYLISAGYSIAIFASVVGAFMLFFYRRKNVWTAVAIAGLIFVALMWSIININSFQLWLLEFFDGSAVADKIQDLLTTSESGVAEGSILDRVKAYQGSVEAILAYPVIGGLWMRSGGGHSAILDAIAKYGICGGVLYINMIFHVPNYYKRTANHVKIWMISNGVMVATLFVGLLDSFNYSFMCMLLLVSPLLYEDIKKWEEIRV